MVKIADSTPIASMKIGIVGAGLMGRLLAFQLSTLGAEITLFDRDDRTGRQSCGYTGAGMLAPISELESAEPIIARLGFASLKLWPQILKQLETPVFFRQLGTLAVAHHLDAPELSRFSRLLSQKIDTLPTDIFPTEPPETIPYSLSRSALLELEPQLGERFQQGIYIPHEAQLDNRQLMRALEKAIMKTQIIWRANTNIPHVHANHVNDGSKNWLFDWVIDCRGLGMQPDLKPVRGVRGEITRVYAPEVELSRPVRLMHPRYPLYIAPRENHEYVIGATSIESEDFRPITLQSALELQSAAFTVHPGFAEASILEMQVNCRPALPDNLPQIQVEKVGMKNHEGLIRINGLYRHGFLISPQIMALVIEYLSSGNISSEYQALFSKKNQTQQEDANYALAN